MDAIALLKAQELARKDAMWNIQRDRPHDFAPRPGIIGQCGRCWGWWDDFRHF